MEYRIDNEEEGKAAGSHYFPCNRRALWSRRQWRIVGDVNNKIKAGGEKNGDPQEIDAWSRTVRWTTGGVTPPSKSIIPSEPRFRLVARKAFTCCEINFSPEISVIVVLSYTGAFYRCKIKRCKLKYSQIMKSIASIILFTTSICWVNWLFTHWLPIQKNSKLFRKTKRKTKSG